MLVIEGYSGKSLEVAKYVNTLVNQDVLIITNDKRALNSLFGQTMNKVYFTEQTDLSDIKYSLELNNQFRYVVFYQNVKKEDIGIFKALEDKFDLKAVLTVQTHDRENPREISTYTV